MTKYIAFLRGINVGGNKKVSMEELRKTLTSSGFDNVQTLLASGNVVFEAKSSDSALTTKKLAKILLEKFGFEIKIILRSEAEIKSLSKLNPFKDINVDKDTRLYITFFGEPITSKFKIPYQSDDGNFRILAKTPTEIISVLQVTPDRGSVDLMAIVEKEFGKISTTRNWNTVEKVVKLLS